MRIFYRSEAANAMLLCFIFALSGFAAVPDFDYDGDGKTDLTVLRQDANGNYVWYTLQSRDGFRSSVFGRRVANVFGDAMMSDDYDGDGRTDIAVMRFTQTLPNLEFYIVNSSDTTVTYHEWGLASTDRPVVQDYDGDGKADVAVFRNGEWWILKSSDGQTLNYRFGTGFDTPFRGGDYDGDGKADLAVVRYGPWPGSGFPNPMTMYIRYSLDGTWGQFDLGDGRGSGVLAGDYDGDGKADVALWQGNLWLWIRSSDNKLDGVRFGSVTQDVPIPGDYDGDGKTDPAVYRQSGFCFPGELQGPSYFYIMGSKTGFQALQWGTTCNQTEAGRRYIKAIGV